jgi:hypothetical protein
VLIEEPMESRIVINGGSGTVVDEEEERGDDIFINKTQFII